MKNKSRIAAAFLAWVFVCVSAAAQTGNSFPPGVPGKHRGAVNAVVRDPQGHIFSAGEDGFVELWNGRAAEERFQISPYSIVSMVLRPGKPELAVIESDSLGLYRLSAWNYETRKRLFTLQFRDSISYINYSASGGFLIVARSGRTGAAFIHPETGAVLESPEALSGSIALAATGRTERTMIVYLSSGILSYWDLETGTEIRRFEVPPGIESPVLFANNRFLGGFNREGLLVIDAVSGLTIARDEYLSRGRVFTLSPDSSRFYCLASSGDMPELYRMEINSSGRLATLGKRNIPPAAEIRCCVSDGGDNVIIGTAQGTLWLLGRSGGQVMETGNPLRIIDAAASPSAVGFISEDNLLGYIPLDYRELRQNDTLQMEDAENYTNIVSGPAVSSPSAANSPFLFWRDGRGIPMLKTLLGAPAEASGPRMLLEKFNPRFPLRNAAVLDKNILLLDTAGFVSVLDTESGGVIFSYSAPGAVDAAFINENTIILGRSAVSGNTPFLAVNTSTGETVPLAYPALVGVRVYRASSGTIYAAAVTQPGGNAETSIIRLNVSSPARSQRLIEYRGEDSTFALAESGGNLASNLGGRDAALYRPPAGNQQAEEMIPLERSRGLPVKIIDGGRYFIVLDGEGSIAWHDSRTGKLQAVLRLEPGIWTLETNGGIITGSRARKTTSPE